MNHPTPSPAEHPMRPPLAPRGRRRTASVLLLSTVSAALMVACGGGGDDEEDGNAQPPGGNTNPSNPANPVGSTLTFNGVAAEGKAFAGAAVSAKCATGSASGATTAADGSYTLSVPNAALPCLVRAELNGVRYHGATAGTETTQTVQLTPLSSLVIANAVGSGATTAFDSFDSSVQAAIAPAKLATAFSTVQTLLNTIALDTKPAGNFLNAPLVTPAANRAGNDYDKVLDALSKAMAAAQTQPADLASMVANLGAEAATGDTAANAKSSSAVLPPKEWMLRASHAHCAGFRTGTVRAVWLEPDAYNYAEELNIDAAASTVQWANKNIEKVDPIADRPCHFKTQHTEDFVLSNASVGVMRYGVGNGKFRLGIVFPKQDVPLAQLVGNWNFISYGGVGVGASYGSATLRADGKLVNMKQCSAAGACQTAADPGETLSAVANSGGAYKLTTLDGHVYFFRTGGGALAGVSINSVGGVMLLTPATTAGLPAVGSMSKAYFANVDRNQYSVPFTLSESKVTAADSATGVYTREAVYSFDPLVTRPETMQTNVPESGLLTRKLVAGQVHSDGSTHDVSTWTGLGLRGTGLFALQLPASGSFGLSVAR